MLLTPNLLLISQAQISSLLPVPSPGPCYPTDERCHHSSSGCGWPQGLICLLKAVAHMEEQEEELSKTAYFSGAVERQDLARAGALQNNWQYQPLYG